MRLSVGGHEEGKWSLRGFYLTMFLSRLTSQEDMPGHLDPQNLIHYESIHVEFMCLLR